MSDIETGGWYYRIIFSLNSMRGSHQFPQGQGPFQVDGEVFDVEEGSVVCVEPDGVRAYRNNSMGDPGFIVVQAKAGGYKGESISDGLGAGTDVEWPGD